VALDETLSAGDDPDGRADALGSWLDHAGDTGRLAMESARGRALAAAGRSREALEVLLRVAAAEPDDLASWEAIRVAARDAQAWDVLVEACDRLAHLVDDPELAAMLFEETAAVLMDELHQDDRAERRLRRVLALDARRPIAYGRLHDLLADREDDAGLLELVSARIELVDDPEELGKLFYEQARLFRSLGMREEALSTLDNLLMLESEHLGGLALLVEIQVQKEDWAGAVEALRTIAGADDVPDSQRRIARLGAADFLENKLQEREGAFDELMALATEGLADRAIYERIATLAEQLERWDEAAAALTAAVAASSSPEVVARIERRAGAIHAERRDDYPSAIDAYARALAAVPTDVDAGEAMAALLDPPRREQLSRSFEQSVREGLDVDPTDAALLRKLRRAAAWRDDRGLDAVVLSVLASLGLAEGDELDAFAEHTQLFARPMAGGAL
jgi:tetratricopeptide (TPR) repeat protein